MSLGQQISPHLPFLRRYGRQLTGSQSTGDKLVRNSLDKLVEDSSIFPRDVDVRLGLYRVFHDTNRDAKASEWQLNLDKDDLLNTYLYSQLLALPRRTREAFLLTVSEGFTYEEAAYILHDSGEDVERLVETALQGVNAASLSSMMENSTARLIPNSTADGKNFDQLLSLAPTPYAPKARATNGKVRLAGNSLELPKAAIARLETLRPDYYAEAVALQNELGNLGGGFHRRFYSVTTLLSEELSEDSSLRLANQVYALNAMRPVINEELTIANATPLLAFIEQLTIYCDKFPSWQAFNADQDEKEDEEAINNLVSAVEREQAGVLADDVQAAIAEASNTARDVDGSGRGRAYLNGLLHNVLAEGGKYLIARREGVIKNFNEKIDKDVGEGLAIGLSNLLIAVSTPLLALAVQMPSTWAWAGPALAAARVFLGRK